MTINVAAPAHIFTTVLLYLLHDPSHYLHRLLLHFCISCILFENYTQLHTQFSRHTKSQRHMLKLNMSNLNKLFDSEHGTVSLSCAFTASTPLGHE